MVLVDAKISKPCPKRYISNEKKNSGCVSYYFACFWDDFPAFTSTKTTLSLDVRTSYSRSCLIEENSTASSWNMKSIRQRKVFVWEKTSPFWWNSFNSIYNRVSYRNSPNILFQQGTFRETTRKIRIFNRKSKFWGPLFFGTCLVSSNQPSIRF